MRHVFLDDVWHQAKLEYPTHMVYQFVSFAIWRCTPHFRHTTDIILIIDWYPIKYSTISIKLRIYSTKLSLISIH